MGHHDEIIFGDAHFPGESCNDTIIRADGLRIDDLLDATLDVHIRRAITTDGASKD